MRQQYSGQRQGHTKVLQLPLNRLSARLWHEFCPGTSGMMAAKTSRGILIFIALIKSANAALQC